MADGFSTMEALAEAPAPLARDIPPATPYPVEALGDLLAAAARGIHDKVQAPIAICGTSVLGAAALATQGHADVVLPTGSARPVSLYLLSILESGGRKSAADEQALWPIRKREAALRDAYDAEAQSAANAAAAWETARDKITKDRKLGRSEMKAALDALGPCPPSPLMPLLTMDEPTVEGIAKLMPGALPSLGIFSAEGGAFINGHAMKDDARLRSAAGFSGLWDGTPLRRVRAGDGALILPGRRVSLHLMAQPEAAATLFHDPVLKDQGFLGRILPTAPDAASGTRMWREPPTSADAAIRRYGARLLSILEAPMPMAEGKRNELAPRRLPLSAPARACWIAFADHIERQLSEGGAMAPIRPLANKLAEHAARIAAVLTLVHNLDADEIGSEAVEAGIELAQHHAAEALRLDAAGQVPEKQRTALRLLDWLKTTWGDELVSLPDITRLGPNSIRSRDTAKATVATLVEAGWLVPVPGGAEVRGERRREVWRVAR
ncbi:MAG: hypothetical protein RLZZ187_2149 [Pseudomonadota bacterium]|jgi:hypothetical protein